MTGTTRFADATRPGHGHGVTGDHRWRQDVDNAPPARDPLYGRSRLQGKPRELVAEDIVYSIKRALDPNLKRGGSPTATEVVVGRSRGRRCCEQAGAKFDYDRPIAGLRAFDRYTVQMRLTRPISRSLRASSPSRGGARSRRGGGWRIRTRAVGTGPYRLREWLQGSSIVLDANPNYDHRVPRERRPEQCGARAQHAGSHAPANRRHRTQRHRGRDHAPPAIRSWPSRLHRGHRGDGERKPSTARSSRSTSREALTARSFPNRSRFRCRST